MRWDLLPDVLTLAGGGALTWPALRAGHVLGRAAKAAKNSVTARDDSAKDIFGMFKQAYQSDSWRRSDQVWLLLGLILSLAGGLLTLLQHWREPPIG